MSYRVTIPNHIQRRIARWELPDFLIVEIHLRLRDELGCNPQHHLHSLAGSYQGMEYRFSLIDPMNRLCEHICTFWIVYSQDEESLIVMNFVYERRVGN